MTKLNISQGGISLSIGAPDEVVAAFGRIEAELAAAGLPREWAMVFSVVIGQAVRVLGPSSAERIIARLIDTIVAAGAPA